MVSIAALSLFVFSQAARAQCATDSGVDRRSPAIFIGSARDDSARLGSLLGTCYGNRSLIRSSRSIPLEPAPRARLTSKVLDPVVVSAWNSNIPFSANDGALWAGRGWSSLIAAGVEATYGRFRLTLAPQLASAQNRSFPILPSGNPNLSGYANPFHSGAVTADLPLRFGDRSYTRIEPGESTLEGAWSNVIVGAGSPALWWGPGIRNALLMSNNATGIPQVFARTRRPVSTRIGALEAYYLVGALTESPYFDSDPRNNTRAISAAVITLAVDTSLTIGVARSVYASVPRVGSLPGHFADVLTNWETPALDQPGPHSDQLTSLFARWVNPASGLAAHAEWAKIALPSSLRSLLVAPYEKQGFTLGLEWARPLSPRSSLRMQAELTTLEQTPTMPGADAASFYASRRVPQGYTQQGQIIGAAVGPGSSSQYLGFDLYHGSFQIGSLVGRIRWEDEAYYRAFPARVTQYSHDVSLFAGLTGCWNSRPLRVEASLIRGRRFSYLFQVMNPYDNTESVFDVPNSTLVLKVTPHR
jgi:hypothetical protein